MQLTNMRGLSGAKDQDWTQQQQEISPVLNSQQQAVHKINYSRTSKLKIWNWTPYHDQYSTATVCVANVDVQELSVSNVRWGPRGP